MPPAEPASWETSAEETIDVDDRWSLRGGPNGGYLASLAVAAGARLLPAGCTPVSASVQFPSRTAARPVRATTRLLRHGRRRSFLQVEFRQDDEVTLTASLVLGDADAPDSAGADRAGTQAAGAPPMPTVPGPDDCVPLPIERLPGRFEHMLLRCAPSPEVVAFAGPAGRTGPPAVGGWTRLACDQPLGAAGVAILADSWPPPPHRFHGLGGTFSTVDITIHWWGRPDPGWNYVWFESWRGADGDVECDGTVWRPDGALVARSRQRGRYRPPP